jgi:hypothetical protein
VFPNPASDNITLQTSLTNYTVEIFDLQGRSVLAKSNLNGIIDINISSLKSGIYTVKVLSSGSDSYKGISKN